jgi:hypothetical protein
MFMGANLDTVQNFYFQSNCYMLFSFEWSVLKAFSIMWIAFTLSLCFQNIKIIFSVRQTVAHSNNLTLLFFIQF